MKLDFNNDVIMSEEIILNLNDIRGIMQALNVFKNVIPDPLEKAVKKALEKGSIPNDLIVQLNNIVYDYLNKIKSENLLQDEQILWYHEVTKGIFKKEILEKWFITNYRAVKINFVNKTIARAGLLISDVVVMNKRRDTSGSRTGVFTGAARGVFGGVSVSSSSSTSRTIGDIIFMIAGKEVIRFPQVSDPDGIKKLVDMVKKSQKI